MWLRLACSHNSTTVFQSLPLMGLDYRRVYLKHGWTKFLVGQVIIMPIIQNTSYKYEPGHRDHFSLKLLWGWCPYQRNRIGLATQLPAFSLGRHSSGHGCSFAYVLDSLAWFSHWGSKTIFCYSAWLPQMLLNASWKSICPNSRCLLRAREIELPKAIAMKMALPSHSWASPAAIHQHHRLPRALSPPLQ